ncbi:unnamed protein product, partial [Effrenium voratum]
PAAGAQWERAWHLFWELQDCGCQADAYSFTSTISACGEGGQWRLALWLFDRCPGGPGEWAPAFHAALSACEKAAQWPQALALLRASDAAATELPALCAALGALLRAEELTRAKALLDAEWQSKGLASARTGWTLAARNDQLLGAALVACEKTGDWRQA